MKTITFSQALRFLADGCGVAIDGQFCEHRVYWDIDNNHLRIDYRDALLIFDEGLNPMVRVDGNLLLLYEIDGIAWRVVSLGLRSYTA